MKTTEPITISKRGRIAKPVLILLVAFCFLPLITNSRYFIHLGVIWLIYSALATNFNLGAGYAGQVTFSHAAFYGMGAYTAAIFSTRFGWTLWTSMPVAFVGVTLIAFLLGVPTLRLRGSYRVICTIGFQMIFDTLALRLVDITNGPIGIVNIPAPSIFGISLNTPQSYYYLAYAWLLINIFILWRIESSRLGYELSSIKGDEQAAVANGVNSPILKLWAFSVTAGLGAVTGAIYAHYIGSIDPTVFTLSFSAVILCMSLFGGSGTIFGGVVGAVLLSAIPEVLRPIQNYRMLIYGLAIILLVRYMPNGLIGWFGNMRENWKVKKEVK